MRALIALAVLAFALAVGCGSGSQCSPATCTGCCLGGFCYGGTSPAQCGRAGGLCSACSDTERCSTGQCVRLGSGGGSGGGGGGSGGGVGGGSGGGGGSTSPTVYVTMRFRKVTVSGFNVCPPNVTYTTCSDTEAMPKAKFDSLRPTYADCTITQTASDAYTINCTNNCTSTTQTCPSNGSRYESPYCEDPTDTNKVDCSWSP